ncbi:hypothetical protein [Streptomyces cucumeris]|uniref:hypothetical protein n=1 Tax=Streptomyces cucumeris TaxID=2962890 RepID=UPI0020C83ABD|nr:hypothetical protein [Streptomyces sp. NEAU-Y11]MCP9209657.1 hypothetical protein [Streptomyces sp. NEAU-Y11]
MSNGRHGKIKPLGFDTAAQVLTIGLSDEAAANLTRMVRDAAGKNSLDDSAALKELRSRLKTAAKRRKTREWAQEVLTLLAKHKRKTLGGALA